MSLIQLLTAIGDESIKVQYIDECTSGMQMTKRQGNKLTVHTDERFTLRGMDRFGFVLWVDREKLEEAESAAQAAQGGE